VHLVGFTIEICCDARSYKRQSWLKSLQTQLELWQPLCVTKHTAIRIQVYSKLHVGFFLARVDVVRFFFHFGVFQSPQFLFKVHNSPFVISDHCHGVNEVTTLAGSYLTLIGS
jgi:hypothetical protein